MSMNILLIEDDRELHDAIVDLLEQRHCRITACASVAEAAAILDRIPDRSRAPDAIVSDTDGLGLYMKARQRFPGMRLILTSAQHGVPALGNPSTICDGLAVQPAALPPAAPAALALPHMRNAAQRR